MLNPVGDEAGLVARVPLVPEPLALLNVLYGEPVQHILALVHELDWQLLLEGMIDERTSRWIYPTIDAI